MNLSGLFGSVVEAISDFRVRCGVLLRARAETHDLLQESFRGLQAQAMLPIWREELANEIPRVGIEFPRIFGDLRIILKK